jgi:major type 1 subunit fimbrin (pilin)
VPPFTAAYPIFEIVLETRFPKILKMVVGLSKIKRSSIGNARNKARHTHFVICYLESSMKQRIISTVLAVVGMAVFTMSAHAADGTITINGTVTDTTCSINGTASGTPADVSVTLPAVPAGSLASAGAVAGTSNAGDIQFAISGCTGTATKAVAHFENGPTVDQGSGYLVNQASASPAKNVEVRLLNAALQPINITTGENNTLASNGATISGGDATLNYFAQYYATGAAQAGNVNTSVQYTMQYQ